LLESFGYSIDYSCELAALSSTVDFDHFGGVTKDGWAVGAWLDGLVVTGASEILLKELKILLKRVSTVPSSNNEIHSKAACHLQALADRPVADELG
jgi:hypothetical protein